MRFPGHDGFWGFCFGFFRGDYTRRRERQRIILLAERGSGRKICYYSAVNPYALGGGSSLLKPSLQSGYVIIHKFVLRIFFIGFPTVWRASYHSFEIADEGRNALIAHFVRDHRY